ncbi:hypothetical protein BS47DRAFT_1357316 [Hydnum rufescens UP504]|uniref:Uncharacterized protein n=1 Tax=Hydnum rufescens UP504 TaxID=1448309 RepID=A0A9P6BCW5_9AGAM|nr:hypothetical protein BS47DRAFT_1357316 [Hydnum rufescens UP504]
MEFGPLLPYMTSEEMSPVRQYVNGALRVAEKDLYGYTQEKTQDRYSAGRKLWNQWIKKHLLHRCHFSRIIDKELRLESLHPISLLRGSNRRKPFCIPLRFEQRFLDCLTMTTFGHDAFSEQLNGDDAYPSSLDGFLDTLKSHIMDRLRKDRDSALHKLEKDRDLCKEHMDGIYDSASKNKRITVHALNSAISKIQKLHDGATYNGDPELSEVAQTYLLELHSILECVGAKGLNTPAKPTRFSRIHKLNLEALATEEVIEHFRTSYLEMITKPEVAEVSEDLNLPAPADPRILDVLRGTMGGQDLGVSAFSDRTSEGLRTLLGWPQDQDSPFLLPFRHVDGQTEFNKGQEALFQHLDPSTLDPPYPFTSQRLQWHQLLGIVSAVCQVFSSSDQASERGILLADEVGLGKTAQGLGLIAFLTQMVVHLSADRPFLRGKQEILEGIHLIVAPNGLVQQWHSEAKTWFRGGAFDLFIYPNTPQQHEEFWKTNGAFFSSQFVKKKEFSRVILITSQNAIISDFKTSYEPLRKHALPWKCPELKKQSGTTDRFNQTIFQLPILSLFLDEAHSLRRKPSAFFPLRDCSSSVCLATATPIHTAPRDLLSLGYLLGISSICTPTMQTWSKTKEKEITALKSKIKGEAKQTIHASQVLQGDTLDPMSPVILHRNAQIEYVTEIQSCFHNRIIRRGINSKNHLGNPINNLPDYKDVPIWIKLTPKEYSVLHEVAGVEGQLASSALGWDFQSFYTVYRTYMVHPSASKGNLPITFESVKHFQDNSSSKLDVLLKLIQRSQYTDAALPPVCNLLGEITWPTLPDPPIHMEKRDMIVIFTEWIKAAKIIQSMLKVFQINSMLYIGEHTSVEQRDSILHAFRKGIDLQGSLCRILIMTPIGAVGINLADANWLILMDQPWSAQDERQAIGRVWRKPQEKSVTIVHLLGLNTTDTVMADGAYGKGELLAVFLQSPGSKVVLASLKGEDGFESEHDSGDEPPKKPGKLQKKKDKTSIPVQELIQISGKPLSNPLHEEVELPSQMLQSTPAPLLERADSFLQAGSGRDTLKHGMEFSKSQSANGFVEPVNSKKRTRSPLPEKVLKRSKGAGHSTKRAADDAGAETEITAQASGSQGSRRISHAANQMQAIKSMVTPRIPTSFSASLRGRGAGVQGRGVRRETKGV